MIIFRCLYCKSHYEVPLDYEGSKAQCENCGNYFVVPSPPGGDDTDALPYQDVAPASSPVSQESNDNASTQKPLFAQEEEVVVPIRPPSAVKRSVASNSYSSGSQAKRATPRSGRQNASPKPSPSRGRGRRPLPVRKKPRANYTFHVVFILLLAAGFGVAYKFIEKKKLQEQRQIVAKRVILNSPKNSEASTGKGKVVMNETVSKPNKTQESDIDPQEQDTDDFAQDSEDLDLDSEITLLPEDSETTDLDEDSDNDLLPVERHGQLHIEGNKLVDEHGNPVALHGMSFFHCGDGFRFRNYKAMKWLRDDWKCDVLRIPILPELYLSERAAQDKYITEFVDNCVKLGVYVVLDFHGGGVPKRHIKNARAMFAKFSKKYADIPNIIYEPFNEPYGDPGKPGLSWSKDIKPYHKSIIRTIRKNDPDNIILLGTPAFSLNIDKVIDDPIRSDKNVMYVAHFYAASHTHGNRMQVYKTLKAGLPVFISEFGTCEYTGNGRLDKESVAQWMKLLDEYKVSWCNWSVHDKNETASILKLKSSSTGPWKESDLRESGKLIRKYLRGDIDLDDIQMESY